MLSALCTVLLCAFFLPETPVLSSELILLLKQFIKHLQCTTSVKRSISFCLEMQNSGLQLVNASIRWISHCLTWAFLQSTLSSDPSFNIGIYYSWNGETCYCTSLEQVQLGSLARTHSALHLLLEDTFSRRLKTSVSFSYVPLSCLQGASVVVVPWHSLMPWGSWSTTSLKLVPKAAHAQAAGYVWGASGFRFSLRWPPWRLKTGLWEGVLPQNPIL